MTRYDALCGLAVLTLLSLPGCSWKTKDKWTEARPKVYPVQGVVLYKGAPVEGAVVVFRSETKQVAAQGTTDSQGRFSLTTYDQGDGVVEGKHQVRISKIKVEPAPPLANPEANPVPPKELNLLPARYADFKTSKLTADVAPSGTNEFEFTLTD